MLLNCWGGGGPRAVSEKMQKSTKDSQCMGRYSLGAALTYCLPCGPQFGDLLGCGNVQGVFGGAMLYSLVLISVNFSWASSRSWPAGQRQEGFQFPQLVLCC